MMIGTNMILYLKSSANIRTLNACKLLKSPWLNSKTFQEQLSYYLWYFGPTHDCNKMTTILLGKSSPMTPFEVAHGLYVEMAPSTTTKSSRARAPCFTARSE